jgi:hypothetical protein
MVKRSILAALALLGAVEAGAEQPLNELFQSEAVYPQEAGEIQLTLRPLFQRGEEGDKTYQHILGLEYGITDEWQLELGFASFVDHDPTDGASTSGIGDLELGTKYSFMRIRESNVHAAVAFEVTVPTGDPDRELGEGFMEYEPSLIVAKDFPEWHGLQLFAQLGLGFVDRVREETSERPAADDAEEEDEDVPVDSEDRADGTKIQPRRPGEFVCQSCFLLKPQSQLADAKRKLCNDCV